MMSRLLLYIGGTINAWLLFILLYLVIPYSFFMECMIVQLHVLLTLPCTLQGICLNYVNSCLRPTDKASTQVKDVNAGLSHKIFLSANIYINQKTRKYPASVINEIKMRYHWMPSSYSLQSESSLMLLALTLSLRWHKTSKFF